jgi:hypothetical protein
MIEGVSTTWPSRVLSWPDGRSGNPHLVPDVFSPDGYRLDRNMEPHRGSEGSLATHRARIQSAARSGGFARTSRSTSRRKGRPGSDALPVVRDPRDATRRHLQLIGDLVWLQIAAGFLLVAGLFGGTDRGVTSAPGCVRTSNAGRALPAAAAWTLWRQDVRNPTLRGCRRTRRLAIASASFPMPRSAPWRGPAADSQPSPVQGEELAAMKGRVQDQQQDKGNTGSTEDVPRPRS